jgi:hypothetical protein
MASSYKPQGGQIGKEKLKLAYGMGKYCFLNCSFNTGTLTHQDECSVTQKSLFPKIQGTVIPSTHHVANGAKRTNVGENA